MNYPIVGKSKSLFPFYPSNNVQESVSNLDTISTTCHHTRLYTDEHCVNHVMLSAGQAGQLKRLTYCKKGKDKDAIVIVKLAALSGATNPSVIFYNIGDTLLVMWDGGSWKILETINTKDTSLQSPVVSLEFIA